MTIITRPSHLTLVKSHFLSSNVTRSLIRFYCMFLVLAQRHAKITVAGSLPARIGQKIYFFFLVFLSAARFCGKVFDNATKSAVVVSCPGET